MHRKLFSTYVLAATLAIALTGCGDSSSSKGLDALRLRDVKLPNGAVIHAEVAVQPEELQRGLKYRTEMADDHGMLFLHTEEGNYGYWMFECKMALDMVWLDKSKRIVEIAEKVPPCAGPQETCPSYGGNARAQYVLELVPGGAAKHGLQKGQTLEF